MKNNNCDLESNSISLSLLTFNILAPCYKKIIIKDTSTSSSSNFTTEREWILESESSDTYKTRMRRIFKLLGKISRNPYLAFDRNDLSPITPYSHFVQSPLNLLFLQEFWYDEDQISRSNSQEFSDEIQALCTRNNSNCFSKFFVEMFDKYLKGYEFFGTQRLMSKEDGVLIGFYQGIEKRTLELNDYQPNKKRSLSITEIQQSEDELNSKYKTNGVFNTNSIPSPWEILEKKSIKLIGGGSDRVATLTHFKSKRKFKASLVDKKTVFDHIYVIAVCTHLSFPHSEDYNTLRVSQTEEILQSIEEAWKNFDPESKIHSCFKFSIFGGDLNVSSKFRHNPKEDLVLSLLNNHGYESIFKQNDFTSHLNHNGEEAPADFIFVNRNVIVKESFLIPKDKPHNKWDQEWGELSDHRPLLACIELNPEVSLKSINDSNLNQ